MQKVTTHSVDVHGWGYFGNVLDFNAVNKYYCELNDILQVQRDSGINDIRNQELGSHMMNHLIKLVKGRNTNVTNTMFKKQTTGAFQPFTMMQEVPLIEKYLWEYHTNTISFSKSTIRD